ncbi:MAG: hypothetical protein OEY86_07050 [Nitrospira sp.]|nr:hypothetical protein [Nitrospira sp.]
MPTWGEILKEVNVSVKERRTQGLGPDLDGIRLKYLQRLHQLTGRAVISYMSGWQQGKNGISLSVEGQDVHGLMECCYQVKSRELDLILHSPGGSPEAAEQMIEYLRTQFDHIRAIVPLQAKSAATMMALGCDEILLGHHSELGPIDPQILVFVPEGRRYAPAHAIMRDFERAKKECKDDVGSLPAWTPILRSYAGGLIEFCHQQVLLSMEVVENWLVRYMLAHHDLGIPEAERRPKARSIAEWFGSEETYDKFHTHGRPLRQPELKEVGLRVRRLEDDNDLQDAVLSVMHANEITFSNGNALKIIENHEGRRKVVIQHNVVLAQEPDSIPARPGKPMNRKDRRAAGRGKR